MFKKSCTHLVYLSACLMFSCNTVKSATAEGTPTPKPSTTASVTTTASTAPGKELQVRELDKNITSQIQEPKTQVAKDQASFEKLWKEHTGVDAGLPKVDFSKEMVLGVFMGEKSTGGFAIKVTKATVKGKDLVVEVTETKPDPSQFVIQIITAPSQLVAVEKVEGTVKFETKEQIGKEN